MPNNQTAAERLFLTADRSKLVRDGDDDAAFLYASPGDTIPQSACEMFGLVDGKLPAPKTPDPKPAPAKKAKSAPANKSKPAPANKAGAANGDKAEGGDA
ncbi:MAG: hypothetical protein AAFQ13_01855 [Pseudomonadota bacterium]